MITEFNDKTALRNYFKSDIINSCYHMADLNDDNFSRCRWLVKEEGGVISSVLLVYSHPKATTILSLGGDPGFKEIIEGYGDGLPASFYFHLFDDHMPVARDLLAVRNVHPFYRMYVRRINLSDRVNDTGGIRQLKNADHKLIADLLLHHPGNFFTNGMLRTGYYYGIIRHGKLAAMAGIHVFSEDDGIAVLGNVVTREEYRNKGYSERCVRHLVNVLMDKVDVIALNVKTDNTAAIRVYEKIGFKKHSALHIGCASIRKDTTPPA